MTPADPHDPTAEARRRMLRRASVYVYGFLAAAIAVAVGGAALVAWFASRRGLPFVTTWAVLCAIIVLPSLLMLVWRAVKERERQG